MLFIHMFVKKITMLKSEGDNKILKEAKKKHEEDNDNSHLY